MDYMKQALAEDVETGRLKAGMRLPTQRDLAYRLGLTTGTIGRAGIVRESDGLAMSSRNVYLTEEERERALSLSRGLERARTLFESGEMDAGKIVDAARAELDRCNARVDYVEVVDPESLRPVKRVESPARLAIAAHIGKTRLIDNMTL